MDRINKLNDMLIQSPNDCFLLHALGLEYAKIGEIDKALLAFHHVITSDKNYVGTYYHLAKTFEKINRLEEAIHMYEQGIIIASHVNDKHAQNELQMALDDLTD